MASDSPAGAAVAPSSAPAVAPAAASKQPPPEKPSETRRRSYIVLSFWLIVLVLGLPIWWKTTTIYRADLPLDRMLQWADGKACRPVFPLRISVRADALPEKEAQHLVQLTQHAIDDLNDFSGHHLRLQLDSRRHGDADKASVQNAGQDEPALTIRLAPGEATSATLNPQAPVLDMTYGPKEVPSVNAASSALASYIADQLQKTFDEEKSIISYLLSSSAMSSGARRQALSPEDADALAKRTTKSLRYAPTYHLTFSLFTDGAVPSSWDVDRALDEYLRPMLDVLRPIHNFTIDTQVQLYATPGVQSQVLGKEHLASFINAAEWPLSPSIGNAPTVNFVVFVGNQTIGIDSGAETSQSWMIPQWGTVYLLSLPPTATHVSAETLRQPMLTFGGHLLSLLGTPRSGSLPLRLSTLARIRSTDLLLRAASSLGSLARLARALPSIAIPRSVADGVSKSMHHLERACASLGGPEGLLHARIAEEEAERAFFEKSMVGQLYFPDEHKIAVYLPLLGPVGVPLVLGLVNELKNWIKRRKQKAAEARDKKAHLARIPAGLDPSIFGHLPRLAPQHHHDTTRQHRTAPRDDESAFSLKLNPENLRELPAGSADASTIEPTTAATVNGVIRLAMLPEPALSLTIPSLHDGTPLDCRVYHPASLAAGNPRAAPWRRHAALLAHPYAPLGGSYDDGVVETLAGRLLREGYLVTTFNFRGAGHSAGRTSWTAKPERDDYASVVGFLVHYVHYLDPFRATGHSRNTSKDGEEGQKTPITAVDEAEKRQHDEDEQGEPRSACGPPVLIMGGYSYGAMITTQVPPLSALLEPFDSPHAESSAAHIRLRAEHLAGQQNEILGGVRAAALARLRHQQQLSPTSPSRRRGGVRIGGDEGPGSPRRSHDSSGGRRSFSLDDAEERLKRGVGELLAKTRRHGHKGARPGSAGEMSRDKQTHAKTDTEVEAQAATTLPIVEDFVLPRAAYVLVSPLQGLVTHLATMNLLPSALTARHHNHRGHDRGAGHGKDDSGSQGRDASEGKLIACPALAVYGDKDVFVPVGKLRAWVARLTGGDDDDGKSSSASLFRAHEVRDAGHFWAEEGALPEMEEVVGEFARRLLREAADGDAHERA